MASTRSWRTLATLLAVLLCVAASPSVDSRGKEGSGSEVQFKVLSQRWMTKAEREDFYDVVGLRIAVRMRLENASKRSVYYGASRFDVLPETCDFHRVSGSQVWQSWSPLCGEEKTRYREIGGGKVTWLLLPRGAALEFDLYDYSNDREEHAASTFIRDSLDTKPREILSDIYRPLSAAPK